MTSVCANEMAAALSRSCQRLRAGVVPPGVVAVGPGRAVTPRWVPEAPSWSPRCRPRGGLLGGDLSPGEEMIR